MTLVERHKNVSEARDILMNRCAPLPTESPVYKMLRSGYKWLEQQMVILEREILADTSGKCGECDRELMNLDSHDDYDCPALDGVSNYPAQGYGPGQRYA